MSGFQMVVSAIEDVPIVHCHIPRTGGMSVDYFFRNVLGDDHCYRLGTDADFIRIRDPNDSFHAFRWKYLSAHLPAREIMTIMGGRKFFMFTILRDPVQREISAFKNIVEHSYVEHTHPVGNFDDYLDMKERLQEKDVQRAHIRLRDEASASNDLLQYLSAGHAIVTVEKNFVIQEYIRATLGTRHVIQPHNISTSSFELTSEQRRRLEPFIEADMALYELVRAAERTGSLLNDWRVGWREKTAAAPAIAQDRASARPAAAPAHMPGPHP
ncbi:sulfotransferase family 2 domain-containing protein [Methylocystis parvus]|nr:sulfotransferase family 2 domain-containing protein [Methylocystis parvus]WBK01302.1 sulfotransferase family protein [Methylocystis parvus OBBP]